MDKGESRPSGDSGTKMSAGGRGRFDPAPPAGFAVESGARTALPIALARGLGVASPPPGNSSADGDSLGHDCDCEAGPPVLWLQLAGVAAAKTDGDLNCEAPRVYGVSASESWVGRGDARKS